ncbi:MAG: BACON domain-containing protein [Bryobacteraceae bacterium]
MSGIRFRYCNVANWKVSPASILAAGNGGTYSFTVTAPPYCTWTASDSVSWISVQSTTKTGSASVSFTVFANFGASRTAYIKVQSGTTFRLVRVDQPSDPHNSPK